MNPSLVRCHALALTATLVVACGGDPHTASPLPQQPTPLATTSPLPADLTPQADQVAARKAATDDRMAVAPPAEPEVFPLPMLPVEPTPAELDPGKADQYDDYKLGNPNVYNITASPRSPVIPAAEWDTKKALTISWTGSFPDVVAGIVENANPVTDVWVVHYGSSAASQFQQQMAGYGVSTSGVNYLNKANNSIWIRDFGPISVFDADTNTVGLVDPRYYHQRIYDDAVPYHFANQWGLNDFRMPVDFEGGNFMADGRGTCFVSQGVLWFNGVSETDIRRYFRDYLGCYQLVILNPLQNEGTTHIDMFTKLAKEDTVVLGEYQSFQDPTNASLMDDNEAIYNSVVLAGGQSLNVVRMPMPGNSGQSTWRTYVNSQFINGVNMIPVYTDDTTYQSQALAIWDSVLPTWQHVPLNATQLITWSGAIHCILMEVQDGVWDTFQADSPQICSNFSCYPASSGGNQGCGSVPVAGQCQSGVASWCDFGTVETDDCAGQGLTCGWLPTEGHYGCFDGPACTPSCVGKACGNDGCGGSCGSCGAGLTCSGNQCVSDTTSGCGDITGVGCCEGDLLKYCNSGGSVTSQNCGGAGCGWDGGQDWYDCGASGADPSGTYPLQCPSTCTPDCAGKQCGPDGCGGVCGTCGAGDTCNAGVCEGGCTPDCAGKSCGGDGCGGSCGTCGTGEQCSNGTCAPVCVPDCAGKQCGSDGCGGSCGTCGSGATCNAGVCESTCTPDCGGKECGDDGCGGTCGTCGTGEFCDAGTCQTQPTSGCGQVSWEGTCSNGVVTWCEDGQVQQINCNSGCCGWLQQDEYYWCWSQEYCGYCVNECQMGETGCSSLGTHTWTCNDATVNYPCRTRTYTQCPGGCDGATGQCNATCTPDCSGKVCGDDGCGGSCGTCAPGEICSDKGFCEPEPCVPDCTGKVCGDDGCGGNCGDCAADEVCNASGQCEPGQCVPQCTGKSCGSDGCGGSCGACAAGELCNGAGQCEPEPCVPACSGKACGDDGCGGSCGTCPSGQFCSAGQCTDTCTPDCAGKACGDDGCGGSCGACAPGQTCTDAGQCVDECTPDCTGKACGGDGCGGSCGTCAADQTCNASGQCVTPAGCGGVTFEGECQGDTVVWCEGTTLKTFDCAAQDKVCGFSEGVGYTCVPDSTCVPQCNGKTCGPDGCGGVCGSCPPGLTCNADGACVEETECGDVTYEGECQGDLVVWCDGGSLQQYDCAAQGKTCGFKEPAGFTCVDSGPCVPDCTGKQCGDDGCGGSCGTCEAGQTCVIGTCTGEPPADEGPGEDTGPSEDVGPGEDTNTPGDDVTTSGDADAGSNPDLGANAGADGNKSDGCEAAGERGAAPWSLLALVFGLVALLRRRRARDQRADQSWSARV